MIWSLYRAKLLSSDVFAGVSDEDAVMVEVDVIGVSEGTPPEEIEHTIHADEDPVKVRLIRTWDHEPTTEEIDATTEERQDVD